MSTNTRILEFPMGTIVEADGTITVHNNITIKVSVTTPNEYGVFKIITQIGDEMPIERITNIKNERIVKEIR